MDVEKLLGQLTPTERVGAERFLTLFREEERARADEVRREIAPTVGKILPTAEAMAERERKAYAPEHTPWKPRTI